jgi:hypothetical protein
MYTGLCYYSFRWISQSVVHNVDCTSLAVHLWNNFTPPTCAYSYQWLPSVFSLRKVPLEQPLHLSSWNDFLVITESIFALSLVIIHRVDDTHLNVALIAFKQEISLVSAGSPRTRVADTTKPAVRNAISKCSLSGFIRIAVFERCWYRHASILQPVRCWQNPKDVFGNLTGSDVLKA